MVAGQPDPADTLCRRHSASHRLGRGIMSLGNDLGGTIREVAARETLARLRPLLAGFGITRLANITGLDTIGIPVWTVVRPLGLSLSVSQGKGITHELATVSGIMECI